VRRTVNDWPLFPKPPATLDERLTKQEVYRLTNTRPQIVDSDPRYLILAGDLSFLLTEYQPPWV
jgi:hypothetical protein